MGMSVLWVYSGVTRGFPFVSKIIILIPGLTAFAKLLIFLFS